MKDKLRIHMDQLKAIFLDNHNWERFKKKHKKKIRPIVIREVEKFLHCGDLSNGFRVFKCEACPNVQRFPIRCKGKFCPTCAVGEAQKWAEVQANDMYHTMHRHVILTIDEGLRPIFAHHQYRETLLKGLMDEAAKVVTNCFRKQEAGAIVALHTFGSKLEFNPHVHLLVTMGGITKDGKWEEYNFLPFVKLRKVWQTVVLKLIRRTLSQRAKAKVQPLLQAAFKNNPDGFYIHAPNQSRTDVKATLSYIGRYMKRGPIALHRIKMYDGELVAFAYQDKRDGEWKIEELSVEDFIGRLIRHIPDDQFKMIRHYGIYSRRTKKVMKKVVEHFQKEIKRLLINAQKIIKGKKWREQIKETFDRDPLECSECGNYLEFRGIAVRKNGSLEVAYANDKEAHQYIRREIDKIESKAYKFKKKEATREAIKEYGFSWDALAKAIERKQHSIYLPEV